MMFPDNKTNVDWDTESGAGNRLRAAREARNLSTQQVASKLRLDVKQIEAMERDEFTSLVAPVFARGYLRSYARFLELSPDTIVKSYEYQKGPLPKVLHGRSVLSDVESVDSDGAMSWVVYLIVLASLILGIVWWQTQGTFKFGEDQPVASFEPELPPPLPDPQESVASVPAINVSTVLPPKANDSAVQPPSAQQLLNPVPVQIAVVSVPATVAQAGENLSSTPAAEAAIPVAAPLPEQTSVIATPADTQAQLQTSTPTAVAQHEAISAITTAPSVVIHLTAKSWVDITDSAGNQLVYKLLPAGTTRTLRDLKLPLKLVLGNPAAVTLEYNGQPFDHSPYSRNGVTRFELGLAQFNSAQ